jgi:hypothetical protein
MPEQSCYVGLDVSLEQTSICVVDLRLVRRQLRR